MRILMTTDTVEKVASATVGDGPARVVGIAKGVGMIEPDMATMIAVLLTDAAVSSADLGATFRRVSGDATKLFLKFYPVDCLPYGMNWLNVRMATRTKLSSMNHNTQVITNADLRWCSGHQALTEIYLGRIIIYSD